MTGEILIQNSFWQAIYIFIFQQIVTLSKYGHDALDSCHP